MNAVISGGTDAHPEKTKKPTWASGRSRFRERFWFAPFWEAHIRARARSTVAAPGPVGGAMLGESRLVPDASATVTILRMPSRLFFA